MSAPFTPQQEARVREIVAEMIGQALNGANARLVQPVRTGDALRVPPTDREIRLECMKIAAGKVPVGADPVPAAQSLYDWVVRTARPVSPPHRDSAEVLPQSHGAAGSDA